MGRIFRSSSLRDGGSANWEGEMKPLTRKSAVPARSFVVIASLLWLTWLSGAAHAEAAYSFKE
jgi:hypothetical protein